MPAFTFQERFVPFVRNKTKRQTIRKFRKYPVKIGQPVTLLTGPRFAPYHIIKEKPVVTDVKSIYIDEQGRLFLIDCTFLVEMQIKYIVKYGENEIDYFYVEFKGIEKDRFAWEDGFRHPEAPDDINGCFLIMLRWWRQTHSLPFVGFVTYW